MFLARTGGNIVYGGLRKSAFISEFSLSLKSGFCTKIWGSSRNPPYTPDVTGNFATNKLQTQRSKKSKDERENNKNIGMDFACVLFDSSAHHITYFHFRKFKHLRVFNFINFYCHEFYRMECA